jgi:DNA-binding response OmpR family regulator
MMMLEMRSFSPYDAPLVLVVEDDRNQADAIQDALINQGLRAITCFTTDDAYRLSIQHRPEFFVLDLNIQDDEDGFSLCDDLRKITLAPIMILTGRESINQDVLTAAELKANHYLNKAQASPEVVALFARQQLVALGKMVIKRLRLGDLQLNITDKRASYGNASIPLTPMITNVLACLMEPPAELKSVENIARKVYGVLDESAVISVRQHMVRLRPKLQGLHAGIEIVTKRTRGYQILIDNQVPETFGEQDAD